GRLVADDVVGAGGADDRSVGLRADGDLGEIGGDGGARPGGGAAGVAVQHIGVVGLAADAGPAGGGVGGAEVGPLGEVDLSEDHGATVGELVDEVRVGGGAPAGEGAGARG